MTIGNLFASFLLCCLLTVQAASGLALTKVQVRQGMERTLQRYKGTSFSGQIKLGREELMENALLDPKFSMTLDPAQAVVPKFNEGQELGDKVLLVPSSKDLADFFAWQEVQHAVARAENFNLPCSQERVYLELCRKRLSWLNSVALFDAQYRVKAAQSISKRVFNEQLLPVWKELEADYFGLVAKDSGAIPENLAGPYVGSDRSCVKGKDVTVAFSPDEIKNLDQKFGVDIDIRKIRPLYNFGPAAYSRVNFQHFVLKPDKECGLKCYYKTTVSGNKAVFESRDGEGPATTTVSFVPPPAVLEVGSDIELVAKPGAVNYIFEGRDVCERSRAFWTVDAFPADAEMNPYRDQIDSAYARFTEKHSTKASLKYRVQPLPENSLLRIRLSASGHAGFSNYKGNTVVFQWLYKVDKPAITDVPR